MLSHVYPFLSTCRRNPSSSSLHYIWHQSGGGRTSNHGKAHLLLCLLIHLLYSITACDLVLVAGWVRFPNWKGRSEEQKAILEDWLNPTLDLRKVADRSKRFIAICSDNDEFVPKEN